MGTIQRPSHGHDGNQPNGGTESPEDPALGKTGKYPSWIR